MKREMKQIVGLSVFAAACMALGMGLSYRWVAKAEEDRPVIVDTRNMDRMPPIAEVAEKLNPAVVAITNTSFVKNQQRGTRPVNPFGGDEFFDWFFGPQRPQQPQPHAPRGGDEDVQRLQAGGSGVIISPNGEILTNFHVVDGLRGGEVALEVKTATGKTYKATVLGKDKELDIALIKIDAVHQAFAALGDSDAAKVGEWVVAIGNPLGLEHSVTQGIISAKGRKLTGGLESFLQTDAAINRGNSGGPLLNLKGEVIGINTAIRADGQNIGFAVPVAKINQVLPALRSGRPVSRGYLGVGTKDLDSEFQDSLGIREGVVVAEVVRGGPGDKAGIRRLDVITAVDGQKIRNGAELVSAIAGHRAGDAVRVTVFRAGSSRELTSILGDRQAMLQTETPDPGGDGQDGPGPNAPDRQAQGLERTYGFAVEPLTPVNRRQFDIPGDWKGVLVTHVAPRSAAMDKGLRAGLVISAVGTLEIEGPQDFYQEVNRLGGRKPLLLLVRAPRTDAQSTLAIPPR